MFWSQEVVCVGNREPRAMSCGGAETAQGLILVLCFSPLH